MSKIMAIVESMIAHKAHVVKWHRNLQNCILLTQCRVCGKDSKVSIDAIYRQYQRGSKLYKCKSCSSSMGWSALSRKAAGSRARKNWKDPNYAGKIVGKAMARSIKKKARSGLDLL